MSRSWSPPLDVQTRTITSLSVIRARPEHVNAIHDIQLRAYPDRLDFHESHEVFLSKLEAYPAGNFVAIVTSSVMTNDDTSTWTEQGQDQEEGQGQESNVQEVDEMEEGVGGGEEGIHGITVVEITETAPDGTNFTTTSTSTSTTTATGELRHEEQREVHIVRARTPDISEGRDEYDDDEDDVHVTGSRGLSGLQPERHRQHQHSYRPHGHNTQVAEDEDQDNDDDMTTVLFQWEQPVGYLFSHPYSRESVTLHRMGAAGPSASSSTRPKKMRLNNDEQDEGDVEMEESEEDPFDHDQSMEKYYVHDCAIHPDWRNKGLASKLWKALEESLTPGRGQGEEEGGDLVDTEEEEEEEDMEEEDQRTAKAHPNEQAQGRRRRHRGGRHGPSKKTHRHRKGAPNLKEIVLVSVQGTKPFWESAGGFQVVPEHDMDLSVYGDQAFLMRKQFTF